MYIFSFSKFDIHPRVNRISFLLGSETLNFFLVRLNRASYNSWWWFFQPFDDNSINQYGIIGHDFFPWVFCSIKGIVHGLFYVLFIHFYMLPSMPYLLIFTPVDRFLTVSCFAWQWSARVVLLSMTMDFSRTWRYMVSWNLQHSILNTSHKHCHYGWLMEAMTH